jgi:hypothetical protein
VKGHSRKFESVRSGADFGLVVEMPLVELGYGDVRVSSRWNGVIVQAKRNWRARRKRSAFATLSSRKTPFDFALVRKFLALGLYRFADGQNGDVALNDIRFVPLANVTGGNEAFVDTVNEMLRDGVWNEGVDAENFFTAVSRSEIGTQNRREIEEFILGSRLPCFRLTLRFRDDGRDLQEVVRVVRPQPVQVVQRRT